MREMGLKEVENYVLSWKNTVTQYIATQPIIKLYEEEMWRMGKRVSK